MTNYKISRTFAWIVGIVALTQFLLLAPAFAQSRWVKNLPPDDLQISRLSPRDGRIYVGTYLNRIHVINPHTETREFTFEFPETNFAIKDMNFSPDGRYLAVVGRGIKVIDTITRKVRTLSYNLSVQTKNFNTISFLDDSSRLLVASDYSSGSSGDHTRLPAVISARTGQLFETVNISPISYQPVLRTFAKGGFTLVTEQGLSPTNFASLDITESPMVIKAQSDHGPVGSNLRDFAIDPTGKNVFTACGAPYGINQLSTKTLKVSRHFKTEPYPHAVAVSPDGKWLYGTSHASHDGRHLYAFRLNDPNSTGTKILLKNLSTSPNPQLARNYWTPTERGLSVSADGTKVFVNTGEDFDWSLPLTDQIQIVDVQNQTPHLILSQSPSNSILSPAQGFTTDNAFPIMAGDFNGDGRQDLARVHGNGLLVYVAFPSGQSFHFSANIPNLFSPSAGFSDALRNPVVTGDWNGDGLTDIARFGNDKVTFASSTGVGFEHLTSIPNLTSAFGYSDAKVFPVIVGDWNGDGRTDFARVHGNGVLFFVSDGKSFRQIFNLPDLSLGQGYTDADTFPIVTGDWNGDGRTDFARVHGNGIRFYRFSSEDKPVLFSDLNDLSPAQGYRNSQTNPIRVADFNGDGISDVVRVSSTGVKVLVGTGSRFTQYTHLMNLSPAQGYSRNTVYPFFAEDVDGDGLADLVRVHGNGILVLKGIKGGFVQLQNIGNGSPAQGFSNDDIFPILFGDFNGDGKKGLARVHGSGVVLWEHMTDIR